MTPAFSSAEQRLRAQYGQKPEPASQAILVAGLAVLDRLRSMRPAPPAMMRLSELVAPPTDLGSREHAAPQMAAITFLSSMRGAVLKAGGYVQDGETRYRVSPDDMAAVLGGKDIRHPATGALIRNPASRVYPCYDLTRLGRLELGLPVIPSLADVAEMMRGRAQWGREIDMAFWAAERGVEVPLGPDAREFWIADRISDDPDIRRAASISEAPGNALRLLGTRWADPAIEARIEAGHARVRLGIRIAEVSLAEAFTGPARGTDLPRILDLLAIDLQGQGLEFLKTFSAVENVPEASAPA